MFVHGYGTFCGLVRSCFGTNSILSIFLDQKFVSMRGWKTEIQSAARGFLEACCDFPGYGDAHLREQCGMHQEHCSQCHVQPAAALWEVRGCAGRAGGASSLCLTAGQQHGLPSTGCPLQSCSRGCLLWPAGMARVWEAEGFGLRREVSWREVLCHHSVSTLTSLLARSDFYLHLMNGSSFKKLQVTENCLFRTILITVRLKNQTGSELWSECSVFVVCMFST